MKRTLMTLWTLKTVFLVAICLGVITVDVLAQERVMSQWDGIYTDEQANRAEPLYMENCAACHGVDLAGDPFAPPLLGPAFTAKWTNRSIGELFDLMRATMPQNSPGGLSEQQNADLLAFILQKGEFPSGQVELLAQTKELNQILFLATKP